MTDEQRIRWEQSIRIFESQISDWERNIQELERCIPGWIEPGINVTTVQGLSEIAHQIAFYRKLIWTNRSDIEIYRSWLADDVVG